MMIANYLLLTLGILGGVDILLYHSISHGIRSQVESRWKLFTHAMRGPTYAILFLALPNFELRGAFAVLLSFLLLFDVGISVADFALERRSRANFGGLPSGEYVLHMVMAMLFGAFVAILVPTLITGMRMPTSLIASDELAPAWVRWTLGIFAAGVFWSGAMDLTAALRLRKLPRPA